MYADSSNSIQIQQWVHGLLNLLLKTETLSIRVQYLFIVLPLKLFINKTSLFRKEGKCILHQFRRK